MSIKKAVTVSSRLLQALHPFHNRQLTVLVCPPWPLRGKTITRETECQRHRQCPEYAYIIPSES